MIEMLAVKIDDDSYHIAVACLPPGFINVPKSRAVGAYLVINEPTLQILENGKELLVIANSWQSAEDFIEHYSFTSELVGDGQFSPIERIL